MLMHLVLLVVVGRLTNNALSTRCNTERNRFDTPLRIEIYLRSVLSPIAKSLLKITVPQNA